jgi:Flp pilus assembly protein TadD
MSIKLTTALGGAALAALSLATAAAAKGPAASDAHYATNAIETGRYAEAEHMLRPISSVDADDPARLVNLATVYTSTGRFAQARTVLERVRKLPDESLILQGGASFSSHRIASTMLSRLPSGR